MAKNNKFPSPANVEVDKNGSPKPSAPKGPLPERKVEGKKVEAIRVHYKGVNHIILHNSVHAVVPGDNFIDKNIMAAAVKHPHIAALVKSKKLIIEGLDDAADESEEQLDESPKEGQE